MRTVVVDDHIEFLRLAKVLLEDLDSIELVGFGHDGEEAVRLCAELEPDLLLMDLQMPRMGGLQAAPLIKAQDRPPVIAIVSSYDDGNHRQQAARAGADSFISKSDFLGSVANLVDDLCAEGAHA